MLENLEKILIVFTGGGSGVLEIIFCIYSMFHEVKKQKEMLREMEEPMEEIPLVSVRARVVSKRTEIFYSRTYRIPKHEVLFWVTFFTDSGEPKEFAVSREKYKKIQPDQIGTLVILNGRFHDFGEGESV